MTPTPEKTDRVTHNRTLAEEWFTKNGIEDTEPAVVRQVASVPINTVSLPPHAYNPSIAWSDKSLWMTYRFHHTRSPRTRLGIAEIEPHGNAVRQQVFDLGPLSAEDARFFRFRGDHWLSWAESDWDGYSTPKGVMKIGRLTKDWKLVDVMKPDYGKNHGEAIEKNWVFFEFKEKLFAIYQRQPEQVVIEFDDAFKVVAEHRSPAFRWLWGSAKGGTTPMKHPNGMLTFFHSTLDNKPPGFYRRYYVGACIMEPKPPFKTTQVTALPIARGSLCDSLSPEERSGCHHFKGRIVFPCGGVPVPSGGWLLSVGVNDCACVILQIKDLTLK